jgi:hypothetical protein
MLNAVDTRRIAKIGKVLGVLQTEFKQLTTSIRKYPPTAGRGLTSRGRSSRSRTTGRRKQSVTRALAGV